MEESEREQFWSKEFDIINQKIKNLFNEIEQRIKTFNLRFQAESYLIKMETIQHEINKISNLYEKLYLTQLLEKFHQSIKETKCDIPNCPNHDISPKIAYPELGSGNYCKSCVENTDLVFVKSIDTTVHNTSIPQFWSSEYQRINNIIKDLLNQMERRVQYFDTVFQFRCHYVDIEKLQEQIMVLKSPFERICLKGRLEEFSNLIYQEGYECCMNEHHNDLIPTVCYQHPVYGMGNYCKECVMYADEEYTDEEYTDCETDAMDES